ncbi:MOSC N-terminal beta barrel domain-containing protein [Streptomyces sp. NPDC003717]|uniref:MOSC domain-containing protein n=1 Tax=Streptomyces sp. NPDC003717 TaxID=3154276 RepID=UPI0033B809CE
MATVASLLSYPIKGCAGVPAHTALLTPAGLAHDRSFMVTSEAGVFRTQRRDPRLALIRPEIDTAGEALTLHAPDPGPDPLVVEVDASGPPRPVDLFGAPYTGIDQGDEAAAWLSAVLGAPSRLVRVPADHHRVTDGRTPGTSGYADSCAVHVLSRSTLALLHERLGEKGAEGEEGARAIPMERFRPNIVVDGWDTPHTEDRAHRITVGDAELAYAKLAIRCAVTMVDQRTGTRAGPEPLRTLAAYRRAPEGGVAFGTKYAVLRPGKLSVGDEVRVTAWGEPEI